MMRDRRALEKRLEEERSAWRWGVKILAQGSALCAAAILCRCGTLLLMASNASEARGLYSIAWPAETIGVAFSQLAKRVVDWGLERGAANVQAMHRERPSDV
jgi:hypothetical protein